MCSYLYIDPHLVSATIDDMEFRKKEKEEEEMRRQQEEIRQKALLDENREILFSNPPSPPPPTLLRTTSYGNQFLWAADSTSSTVYDNDKRGETLPLSISRTPSPPSPRMVKSTHSPASSQSIAAAVKSCTRCNIVFFVTDTNANDSFCSIDCKVCSELFTGNTHWNRKGVVGDNTNDPVYNPYQPTVLAQGQTQTQTQTQTQSNSPKTTPDVKNVAKRNLFLQAYYERELTVAPSPPPSNPGNVEPDDSQSFYLHTEIQRSKLQTRL